MGNNREVTEIVLHWDELRQQGQDLSPEELCRDCPEHLEDVERRIRALHAAYQAMGTASPDGEGTTVTAAPSAAVTADTGAPDKPAIAGYDILGELGRGGMGVVYQARHVQLRRTVALKMILHGAHAGREELTRFRSEAEAIARLQHPNLVQIYEIGEHNGLPFFALEFVEGGSLDHQLQGNPQPPEQAAQVVETLARAMQVAHEAGVVHRDLKPANVLVGKGGVVKITDFGLAKRLDAPGLTASGAVMGTPSYMAPEQAGQSKAIGPAADVYALGAILYELLTGRPPFRAATPMDTLLQVLGEEPVPPSRLNPKVPRDLETVCLKCLEKDPGRRYGSAEALARDLGHWRAGKPISARPVGRGERVWRWCLRNRAVAALLAAVGLVLVGGVVGVTVALVETNAALDREKEALEQSQDKGKKLEEALTREREARNNLNTNLSELATVYCTRSGREFAKGNVRDTLSWMLRAYEVAPPDDPLRGTYRQLLADHGQSLEITLLHADPVHAVAFSPDGRTVLTGSGGEVMRRMSEEVIKRKGWGEARLWDAATGQPRGLPLHHEDYVWAVAFSPDGRTVLTGSWDKTARLWDAATGQRRGLPFRHEGPVCAVAFSPDGRTVLTGSYDNTARLWDAATGQPRAKPLRHEGTVRVVAFSPDGRTVLTGSGASRAPPNEPNDWGEARLWDAATGEPRGLPLRHEDYLSAAAFSPDGRTVLTGSLDKTARLWDAGTGQPRGQALRHEAGGGAVAMSRDGRTVVTGGKDKTAQLWDAATGQPRGQPLRHEKEVLAVAFSPDGRTVLTGSLDKTARLWDAGTGQPRGQLFRHEAGVHAVAFSPDGQTVLTASQGIVRLWDAGTGQPRGRPFRPEDSVIVVAFSPDGRTLITAGWKVLEDEKVGGEARLWDTSTGQPRGQPLRHDEGVLAVAFSPDGRTVFTGSNDKTVRVWDAVTGQPRGRPLRHENEVTALAFSPDGRTLLTGSKVFTGDVSKWKGEVRLWDTATGQPRGRPVGHEAEVRAVTFSPDGRTVLIVSHGIVRQWDLPGPAPDEPARLKAWVHVRTGKTVERGMVHQLSQAEWLQEWQRLQARGGDWQQRPSAHGWHLAQADDAEVKGEWFAAVFHLSRLVAEHGANSDLRRRRDIAYAKLGESEKAIVDGAAKMGRKP
jgi:WD40 repeat protein